MAPSKSTPLALTDRAWWSEPQEGFHLQAEAVVVGSGAGGAFAAVTLAEAGIDTVVLEEGFRQGSADFSPDISASISRYFAEGGFRTTSGKPPIPLVGGRGLGGSTLVNSAISFRTPEAVLAEWNERSGGAFEDTDHYYRTMDAVEAVMQVGATPDGLLSGLDRAHKEAANKLGWSNHNFRRNTPRCVGCGRCNQGCPVGGKNSVDRALLPRAAAAGARFVTGSRVDLVSSGQVAGAVVDRVGVERGRFTVSAPIIVLAAGSVSTPRLLLDSGLGDEESEIGDGLMVHPVFSVIGRVRGRRIVAPGSSQGHYIDEFAADRMLFESNPTIPGAIMQMLPMTGHELAEAMAAAGEFANTGVMLRDRGRGRVLASRGTGDRARYVLDEADRLLAIEGMRRAGRLWLEGLGAEYVAFGVYGGAMAYSVGELEAVLPDDLPAGRLVGYSSHPQATCSVGRATDKDGQVPGAPGVYCMDASALPANVGRNPQISVMTVARVLAERLVEKRGGTLRPLWPGPGPVPGSVPQPGVPAGVLELVAPPAEPIVPLGSPGSR